LTSFTFDDFFKSPSALLFTFDFFNSLSAFSISLLAFQSAFFVQEL